MLRILERRLDNAVFRSGFGQSRDDARQLVLHRHVLLNGRITKTPSVLVRIGDTIQVKEKSKTIVRVLEARERSQSRTIPGWLAVNMEALEAKVVSLPERAHIDAPVKESFVVEFYSR